MTFGEHSPGRRRYPIAWALAVALVVAGCATPQPQAVSAFRQGVVAANQQTTAVFAEVNSMLREQQLDRAALQPTLSEDLFAEGLPADARATWTRAYALMDEYAAAIEALLAPEQRTGVEEQLRELGDKLAAVQEDPLPEGVAGGFVKLGGLLVQIKANEDALGAMRRADPAIQEIFSTMATAIGASQEEGVRLTVWSAWTTTLGGPQVQFLKAQGVPAKRRVAEAYLKLLGERDSQDELLASLRVSLLSLGGAHRAMARGDQLTAQGFIAIVQEEYKGVREEIERIRKTRGQGGSTREADK